MATRKKQPEIISLDSNYENVKNEIIHLLTGHEAGSKEDINYAKLVTRVTLLLVAVYGIGRISMLRKLAISVVTSFVTKYLAERASALIPVRA